MEDETQEIIEKIDNFFNKKDLDLQSKYNLTKMMNEEYWNEIKGFSDDVDEDFDLDDDLEEKESDDDEDYGDEPVYEDEPEEDLEPEPEPEPEPEQKKEKPKEESKPTLPTTEKQNHSEGIKGLLKRPMIKTIQDPANIEDDL